MTDREQALDRQVTDIIANLNALVIYAERYSIVRQSYANGTMAKLVKDMKRAELIYTSTSIVLQRDIEQALADDSIPYADQRQEWQETLNYLKGVMA